jgi:hypothetical protein
MEYKSTNSGLLAVSMVRDGDKLILLEEAYSQFVPAKQKTYWNVKVELPDGSHKLAGLMESSCDEFARQWGKDTKGWTGHTVVVNIKTSKAGNPYITLAPSSDAVVDVEARRQETFRNDVAEQEKKNEANPPEKTIEYPSEEISLDDIPF